MANSKEVEFDQFNGDLISRKTVIEELNKIPACFESGDIRYGVQLALNEVNKTQAVEAEPVRHGRWRFCGEDRWNDAFECSECGKIAMENSDYCQHCGAKMDGGNNVERIMDL